MSPNSHQKCRFSVLTLQRLFRGIARAQWIDAEPAQIIRDWMALCSKGSWQSHHVASLQEWQARIETSLEGDLYTKEVAELLLGVAYLHVQGRYNQEVDADLAWNLIRKALVGPYCHGPCHRSPQCFWALHLCSLMRDEGKTDELYRVHVWLPDGDRPDPGFQIHSHQAFAQSWILAGQGTDRRFAITPSEKHDATHAEYGVTQNFETVTTKSGRSVSRRVSSTISNAGRYVSAIQTDSELHTRGMMYTIPAGHFHTTGIALDAFHATLFVFDSARGWDEGAPVLGPKDGTSFTNIRFQEEKTASFIVQAIDAERGKDRLSID
jgi:hypothetical protein